MFNSRLNSPPTCGPALSASWPAITTAYKITLYVAIQIKTMIQNQGQQTQTHQQMKVVTESDVESASNELKATAECLHCPSQSFLC